MKRPGNWPGWRRSPAVAAIVAPASVGVGAQDGPVFDEDSPGAEFAERRGLDAIGPIGVAVLRGVASPLGWVAVPADELVPLPDRGGDAACPAAAERQGRREASAGRLLSAEANRSSRCPRNASVSASKR